MANKYFSFSAKVKLSWQEFDVDSEEICACSCGVSAADCVALAARMKSGEMRRLKKLELVRLFSVFQVLLNFPHLHLSSALFHRAPTKSAPSARAPSQTRFAPTAVCSGWTLCVCVVAVSLNCAARLFQYCFSFVEFPPSRRLSHCISCHADFYRLIAKSLSLPHATSSPASCTTPSSPRCASTTSPPPAFGTPRGRARGCRCRPATL
jgi:hypothetical protein